jgi:hypothetical protein
MVAAIPCRKGLPMRRLNLRISLAAKFVAAVMIFGCALSSGASYFSFSQLKVGGPVYKQVAQGKDLVADILPPPEYLIEVLSGGDPCCAGARTGGSARAAADAIAQGLRRTP